MRIARLSYVDNKDVTYRRLSAGAWSVEVRPDNLDVRFSSHTIRHHGTVMLGWYAPVGDPTRVVSASGWLGYGSVSDQEGVNKILRELMIPVRYSRRGGAHYEAWDKWKDDPRIEIGGYKDYFSYETTLDNLGTPLEDSPND